MSDRLVNAVLERKTARRKVIDVLKQDYPIGHAIAWTIGSKSARGHVVMHCADDRIKVLNTKTGRERFIYATDIQ